MPDFTDPNYLLNEQYKTPVNLNTRITLHKRFSTNPYGWCRWVFDQFDLPARCRILELGCGVGGLWLENMDRLPSDWQIFLSDFSGGMARQARENLAGIRQASGFARIDAQRLPIDDGSFEAVIANHMLPHVPDRWMALAEIQRVLRPGGKLFATTMGGRHLAEIQSLVGEFDPELVSESIKVSELFTLENGASQIQECFTSVRMDRYIDSLRVTEAAPLADYILSTARLGVVREKRGNLVSFLERKLAENGGLITIMKDSGIFVAQK